MRRNREYLGIFNVGVKYTHYHLSRAQLKLRFTSIVRLTKSPPSFAYSTLRRLNDNKFTGSVNALVRVRVIT